ncbi:hypothetical protein ABT354_12690 [Streptomyces sp. NPDC000594]|uniref:hypothetical protein n=1 Tax=Streptomyces sp. NPDC000594 TaxID=3154261 RepID=UPI00331F7F62
MKRRTWLIGSAVVVAGTVSVSALWAVRGPEWKAPGAVNRPEVVADHPDPIVSDHPDVIAPVLTAEYVRPSHSAEDWVTYADHAVVVSVRSQSEIPPSRKEIDKGAGVIGREVVLRTEQVLWSRPGMERKVPERWKRQVQGWHFEGDPSRRASARVSGEPRLEPGHRYVLALHWSEARCAKGAEREPASWDPVGDGAMLPFDGGTLGNGEHEGGIREVPRVEGKPPTSLDGASLAERLHGRTADLLVAELTAAKPGEREYGPEPAPCPGKRG